MKSHLKTLFVNDKITDLIMITSEEEERLIVEVVEEEILSILEKNHMNLREAVVDIEEEAI